MFVPADDHATAAVKTYGALGMGSAGIKLIGPGDVVQDSKLQGMGHAAVGLITIHTTTMPISTIRKTSGSSPPGRRNTAPTQ